MKIKASKQRKILTSVLPPKDKEFLWLQLVDGKSVLKDFVNGLWVAVGDLVTHSPTDGLEPYVPSTPTLTDDYVTSLTLNLTLLSYVNRSYFQSTLSNYQKKLSAGTGIKINNDVIYVKLVAGNGIKIDGDKISCTIQVPDPQNPDDPDTPDPLAALSEQVATLSSTVTAMQEDEYVPRSWFKTINDEDIYSSEGGDISISGGTGGGIDVKIVSASASTTARDTLYFFLHSPNQGEGLYNTLVQEGSLTYLDENDEEHTFIYDPRKLYHLYNDGSFEVLTPESSDITFQDNVVYYKGKRTTMLRYGELICTHKILYSTTADTAYFSFQIAGPFYNAVEINGEEVAQTPVTLRYDNTKVKVYEVTKTVSGNNTTWTETLRADGYVFTVGNNDFSTPRTLHFVRQGSDFSTHMNVAVRFVVGDPSGFHMDTDIHVKFPKADVLFKADPSKTLAQINANLPAGVNVWDSSYCSLDNNGRLQLANSSGKRLHEIKTLTIDQTKKRTFYSKVYGNDVGSNMRLDVMWDNWKGYNTQSVFNIDQLYWYSSQQYNRVYGDFFFAICEMLELNHSFRYIGSADMINNLFYQESRNTDNIDVTLCVRQRSYGSGYLYDEIGILEYDDNLLGISDEYPAIPQ